MRVRLTQIIDYWVGVPLCLFFAALQRLGRPFSSRSKTKPARLLFIEISEMGSAIIAYSSIARAKEFFRTENLYFLIFEKNRESVELLGLIPPENIIGLPDKSFAAFVLGVLKALLKVRRLGIDTAVDLELFSRFTALFSLLCGAKNRVGFSNYTAEGLYRGSFLTHPVFYNPHQHMSLNFLALVCALAAPEGESPLLKREVRSLVKPLPHFKPTPEERTQVWSLLRACNPEVGEESRLIVLNPDPGEALPIRGWAMESFAKAARDLAAALPDAYFAVIGLGRSKPYAAALTAALPPGRCLDLTGRTRTLREVVTLFSISELLLGGDSGPAHFAALTGIKIITLFGPETPALYGPLSENASNVYSGYSCSPCLSAHNHRYTVCRDNKCLKAIKPSTVTRLALEQLNRSAAANQ